MALNDAASRWFKGEGPAIASGRLGSANQFSQDISIAASVASTSSNTSLGFVIPEGVYNVYQTLELSTASKIAEGVTVDVNIILRLYSDEAQTNFVSDILLYSFIFNEKEIQYGHSNVYTNQLTPITASVGVGLWGDIVLNTKDFGVGHHIVVTRFA